MNEERATIDFETRSACPIQRAGSWIYAKHPSTVILCLSWVLPGQDPNDPSLWHPGFGDQPGEETGPTSLQDLFDYIRSGGLVEAHNAMFERVIWKHIAKKPLRIVRDPKDNNAILGAKGMGAPPILPHQWRCSAAKASAFAFPRDLEGACAAVGVAVQKDATGRRIMLELSKPRRARKGEDKEHVWFNHDPAKHRRMHEYCRTDVRAEHALSEQIPDLSPFELRVWQTDQKANLRGIRVDMELVDAAIKLDERVKARMNRELRVLTGIEAGTRRTQILQWLRHHGCDIEDTAAPTLDWLMKQKTYRALPPEVQRVVVIARNINRTSVTKFKRIREMADPDDFRVRDLVRYHGAATGRWAGSGIQVQNFPRGNLPDGTTIEQAVADVKEGNLDWIEFFYTDPLMLLSSVTRGALIADKGKRFYVADYAAIEARVVLWLAGADKALDVFRRGEDIYCDIASAIYGRPITKKDKDERQLGKMAILGLGYGMGYLTFFLNMRVQYDMSFTKEAVLAIIPPNLQQRYREWVRKRLSPRPEQFAKEDGTLDARAYRVAAQQARKDIQRLKLARENPADVAHELALCKYLVDVYRARYSEVPKLWKAYEEASLEAVKSPGEPFHAGRTVWIVEGRFLRCYLPSGRFLTYADPFLKEVLTPWGSKRLEVRYWGVHKKTRKWSRMGVYGGLLTENVDQATARDMMAYAMLTVEDHDTYEPLATIHDELIAEADEDAGDKKEFERLLTSLPDHFAGCPVSAEGDTFHRYRK